MAVLLGLVLTTACTDSGGSTASSASAGSSPPTSSVRPVEASALYYKQLDAGVDLSAKLGNVDLVVVPPQRDEGAAIKAIHDSGAKAFQYVQYYWAPADQPFEGLDLGAHPEWAFCGSGSQPLVGRTAGATSTKWFFLDLNEKSLLAQIASQLGDLRSRGWDGVMFDRGWAATQSGTDLSGADVWSRASTCTDDPVAPNATFSDAYVAMTGEGHKAGLEVLLNSGFSPFDPVIPMRPDPASEACRAHEWANCTFVDDVWPHVDFMLDEAPAHPGDTNWGVDFEANTRNEKDRDHRGRVLGLITSGTLAPLENNHDNVYFEWSRARLFDFPVTVNTGDGGCPGSSPEAACNQKGIYPELNSVRLGQPIAEAPASMQCDTGSTTRCVWYRQYSDGLVVVNVSRDPKPGVQVPLGVEGCRYVLDLHSGQPLFDDRCVTSVSLDLGAGSGRPLVLSRSPL